MQITALELKHFRCFTQTTIAVEDSLILIEGENGTGKSSLIEALHYLCYLRSFRTYNPRHLVKQGADGFFVKVSFKESADFDAVSHDLQVGFVSKKRSVKLDGRSIASYKELMEHYRIITISENDLELINGAPEVRRNFMDQAIVLANPEYSRTINAARKLVEQRNSLLRRGNADRTLYLLWTEQLWEKTVLMQEARIQLLANLQESVNHLIATHFADLSPLSLLYQPKKEAKALSFDDFWEKQQGLYAQELDYGYSLMGAHLDDCSIRWHGGSSKLYASRGQQKLLVLLLKIAQVQRMRVQKGTVGLLVDDFLTDFDQKKALLCLQLLHQLPGQCIITTPLEGGFLADSVRSLGGSRISLTKEPFSP